MMKARDSRIRVGVSAAVGCVLAAVVSLATPIVIQAQEPTWPAEIHANPVSAERHLKEAVTILVERSGPLGDRLMAAASNQLTFPQPDWFPTPKMQLQFEQIQDRIYEPRTEVGQVAALEPDAARLVATEIFSLYLELREYLAAEAASQKEVVR